jgi:hypothetical protein
MSDEINHKQSKAMFWTGCVISAIPILATGVMGAIMAITSPKMMTEGMAKHGYSSHATWWLVGVEIACAVIYAIPRTAMLGAILLTGYFGGAVSTHVRAGEAFWIPVVVGVLVWLGLFLRDGRLRELVLRGVK